MNEELEQVKLGLQNADTIVDVEKNPTVQALLSPIKKIPYLGSLISSATERIISDFQKKKEQELMDVILKDKNTITFDMVNDVEFIINYSKTLEAVRRLATNDKVKFFGNLIRNGYFTENKIESSEFEEYIHILNTMSYREIECLVKYYLNVKDKPTRELLIFKNYDKFTYPEEDLMTIQGLLRTSFVREKMVNISEKRLIINPSTGEKMAPPVITKRDGFIIQKSFVRFYEMVLKVEEDKNKIEKSQEGE